MPVEAFSQACEGAETWMHGEREKLDQDIQANEEEVCAVRERSNKRFEGARAAHEEVKKGLLTQEQCLK
jgi:hypothetical protein